MSRQISPSTDKVYGLERVSRLWGVSRATIYRHRHRSEEAVRRRPGPQGVVADEGLVAAIQELLRNSPFHGEGYRKLWARRFDTVEELRLALLAFRQTYNQFWIIERHGYRTPAQVRAEQATALPMAA